MRLDPTTAAVVTFVGFCAATVIGYVLAKWYLAKVGIQLGRGANAATNRAVALVVVVCLTVGAATLIAAVVGGLAVVAIVLLIAALLSSLLSVARSLRRRG